MSELEDGGCDVRVLDNEDSEPADQRRKSDAENALGEEILRRRAGRRG